MDVSILLSTWRRPDTLGPTLEALSRLATGPLEWQVLVADNADDPATQALLRTFEGRLPLRWCVESRRGKNQALNRLLPDARGRLLVFTDDDVEPQPDWLLELHAGAQRWPGATMFTGRILPSRTIPFDLRNNFVRCAYMVADWEQPEGPIRHDRVWGPNMALRASVFEDGTRFDVRIGPSGHDYAMGSEIELAQRLAGAGHGAVYLPRAQVTHLIRGEQLTEEWLLGRVYRSGRGVARLGGPPNGAQLFGRPRYLYREMLEGRAREWYWRLRNEPSHRLAAALDFWHARGKAHEYARMPPAPNVPRSGPAGAGTERR